MAVKLRRGQAILVEPGQRRAHVMNNAPGKFVEVRFLEGNRDLVEFDRIIPVEEFVLNPGAHVDMFPRLLEWNRTPRDEISYAVTWSGPYVFSERHDGCPLAFRPPGTHEPLGWFRSPDDAKRAAEQHAAGVRCNCSYSSELWERYHDEKCALLE